LHGLFAKRILILPCNVQLNQHYTIGWKYSIVTNQLAMQEFKMNAISMAINIKMVDDGDGLEAKTPSMLE